MSLEMKGPSNPFRLGFIHPGDPFCDRVKETADLVRHALNTTHVVIYSPRRYGKTSLVKHVMDRITSEDFVTVYVDYFSVASKDAIVQKLVAGIIAALGKGVIGTGIFATLKNIFTRIVPSVEVTPEGVSISAKYDKVPFNYLIEDIFSGLERHMESQNKRCLIVFDEFQQISEVGDSKSIEALFREHVQAMRRVGCFFVGSRRRVLKAMFTEKTRPFYGLTLNYPIDVIPESQLVMYVCNLFAETGIECPANIAEEMYDYVRGNTSYVQKMSHFLWDFVKDGSGVATAGMLAEIKSTLLENESPQFQGVFSGLTAGEKRALIALAKEPTVKPYAIDYIARHDLSIGGMQRSIRSLLQQDIIEIEPGTKRYQLTDSLIAKWCIQQVPLYQMDAGI